MRPNTSTTIDHSEACILSCKNSELPARGWDHHSGQGEGEGGLNVENGEAFWSGPKSFVLTGTLAFSNPSGRPVSLGLLRRLEERLDEVGEAKEARRERVDARRKLGPTKYRATTVPGSDQQNTGEYKRNGRSRARPAGNHRQEPSSRQLVTFDFNILMWGSHSHCVCVGCSQYSLLVENLVGSQAGAGW